jgi:hypothetical protein
VLGVVIVIAGCGGQTQDSPAASASASAPASGPADTTAPSETTGGSPSTPPSVVPTATPGATAAVAEGFHVGDILKVQVDRLAARVVPTRSSALVHAYDVSGSAPEDKGVVRLSKGDYVSVELGPVPIGDTVWYLVWPAPGIKLHPGGTEWYTKPPNDGSPIAAWVAASVGTDVYMSLQRRPDAAEIEMFAPSGVTGAGLGNYVSAPQPRHDGFLFWWAAAAPVSGTSCSIKIALVPSDGDFNPKVALATTTTTTVKVGPLAGAFVTAPWLPAPEGSWETFTVEVTSTCNWAFRLLRLEHD